jgi:hypothetical protein
MRGHAASKVVWFLMAHDCMRSGLGYSSGESPTKVNRKISKYRKVPAKKNSYEELSLRAQKRSYKNFYNKW